MTGLGQTGNVGSIARSVSLGKFSFLRVSFLFCKTGPTPPSLYYLITLQGTMEGYGTH